MYQTKQLKPTIMNNLETKKEHLRLLNERADKLQETYFANNYENSTPEMHQELLALGKAIKFIQEDNKNS